MILASSVLPFWLQSPDDSNRLSTSVLATLLSRRVRHQQNNVALCTATAAADSGVSSLYSACAVDPGENKTLTASTIGRERCFESQCTVPWDGLAVTVSNACVSHVVSHTCNNRVPRVIQEVQCKQHRGCAPIRCGLPVRINNGRVTYVNVTVGCYSFHVKGRPPKVPAVPSWERNREEGRHQWIDAPWGFQDVVVKYHC